MATIDMQSMRYINLLTRVSNVRTQRCFAYNNMIIFAVPGALVNKAVGAKGQNVREMQETLGKRIKIIKEANGLDDAERFVKDVVDPVGFKSIEVNGEEMVINAGSNNKAALIGRNRRRLEELEKIIQDIFGKQLKII